MTDWPRRDWITTSHAAEILGVEITRMRELIRYVPRKPANGRTFKGSHGALWKRALVEKAAEVRRGAGVPTLQAAKVAAWIEKEQSTCDAES